MRILFVLFIGLVVMSCSPRLSYLGDSYNPTNDRVDSFYDELDIRREYRVIGLLSADSSQSLHKSLDNIRDSMIEEASKRGADGILFVDFYSLDPDQNDTVVKAKLLRYE